MKVQSTELLIALKTIELVPSRAGIPSSEFIRLTCKGKQITFALTAEVFGEVIVNTDEAGDWVSYVDRGGFLPFVYVSRDIGSKAPFKFTYQDKSKTLIVRCGRRRAIFNHQTNVTGYSEIDKLKRVKFDLREDQKRSLTLTSKYATPDPTVAHLNCVYCDKSGYLMASNEKAAISIADKKVKTTLPLPLGLIASMQDTTVKYIAVGKDLAKVQMTHGYLCQMVNRKAMQQFPVKAIHSAMNAASKYPKVFSIAASKLVPALERLDHYTSIVVKRDTVIELSAQSGDKTLKLLCKTPGGRFEEYVTLKSPVKQQFSAEWLLQLLTPLSAITKDAGEISVHFEETGITPYRLKVDNVELLVSRRVGP